MADQLRWWVAGAFLLVLLLSWATDGRFLRALDRIVGDGCRFYSYVTGRCDD
jgi:hypothetical protein